MAAASNPYFVFGFMTIPNEPLEIKM